MSRYLILFSIILSLFGQASVACEAEFGRRVHVLLGPNESNLRIYSGEIIVASAAESKVEFETCYPSCFKWINNCAFFSSRHAASEASRKLDEDHTSFTEGAVMAGGALVLLGVLAVLDGGSNSKPQRRDPLAVQNSTFDDTKLQGMD